MNSRQVIRILEKAGWTRKRTTGDHHHYVHPDIPGLVTVTHPVKDLPIHIIKDIEKKTGIKLRK
jgi:predicted RNA binding protein YcfA (HicA-like mRNA interferase family)